MNDRIAVLLEHTKDSDGFSDLGDLCRNKINLSNASLDDFGDTIYAIDARVYFGAQVFRRLRYQKEEGFKIRLRFVVTESDRTYPCELLRGKIRFDIANSSAIVAGS